MTRQRRWQIKMRAGGRCMICGKMADGTRGLCRPHADARQRRGAPKALAYKLTNPLNVRAHNALNNAITAGRVIRPTSCSRCGGSDTKINGHHHDYTQPFDVVWLCYSCHAKTHQEEATA